MNADQYPVIQCETCQHYQRGYSQTYWEPGEPPACLAACDLETDEKSPEAIEIELFDLANAGQCPHFTAKPAPPTPTRSILDVYKANADLYQD